MLGYDNISINLLAPAVWEPILYQLEDPHQANYWILLEKLFFFLKGYYICIFPLHVLGHWKMFFFL